VRKLLLMGLTATLGASVLVAGCSTDDEKSTSTTTTAAPTTTLDDENPNGALNAQALAAFQADLPHPANVSYDGDTLGVAMPAGTTDEDAKANCESARSFATGAAPETAISVTVDGVPAYVSEEDACTKV